MSLQVVIEVRQVNQVQRGRVFVLNPFCGFGNPARGAIGLALRRSTPAAGPQKPKKKFAEIAFDFRADGIRPGVNMKIFRPSAGYIGRGVRE